MKYRPATRLQVLLTEIRPGWIFLLAITLRLSLFLFSQPWASDWPQKVISADSFEYTVLGRSLIERGEFSYTWPVAMPNALRLPIYPLFVALTSGFGTLSLIWLTSLTQIVIDSLFAAFLIKCIGGLFLNSQAGRVAAILYAINPDAIFWSTQIMPESFSVWVIIGSLYGLSAAYQRFDILSLARFTTGAACASVLPLVKPAWQYLWVMLIAWTIIAAFRSKRFTSAALILCGCLVIVAPGAFWIDRNAKAWGVPRLSVNGPLAQQWAAKAILDGVEGTSPDYAPEMAKHIGLIADISQEDWIPARFKQVVAWNRDGLAEDIEQGKHLLPFVLHNYLPQYVKSAALGTLDVLIAPQNKSLKEFLGTSVKGELKWKTMSGAHIDTKDKIFQFLLMRLTDPFAIFWSAYVFGYLSLLYIATLSGIKYYFRNHLWSIWTLFIIGVASMMFLMGPLGQARYRFVMTQPLLPVASLAIASLVCRLGYKNNEADPGFKPTGA